MKKPIDPNLNNDSDFDIVEDFTLSEEGQDDVKAVGGDRMIDVPLSEHHHHHSSGEHHHSSGEHHHSSGEHHHSSGEHHHHHSSSGHSSHSHKHKHEKEKKPFIVRFLAFILVVVLVIAVLGAGAFLILDRRGKADMKNVAKQTEYQDVVEYNGHKYVYNEDVVSVAFLGIDKRELDEVTTIGTAGQADADMVVTVNTATGRVKVIAVPRDTMVDVDLYSEDGEFLRSENMQLCLSYAYGNGTDTSAENVLTSLSRILYNVPINKYFALDLDGIAPINDAIGGVTVESLYNFKNKGIAVGDKVHLTGEMTETYVRQRDLDDVEASLNRTARQIQYVKAFAAQLVPAVKNDFSIVNDLYNTASLYSTTNIDISNVTYMASLLLSKGITDFESVTLEGEMKESDRKDYNGFVYAEFYPDEDSTLETVLDTFYTQID